MPRIFCKAPLVSGKELLLEPGAARHVQVLRLQPGMDITLFNSLHGGSSDLGYECSAGEFEATITRMGKSDVQVLVGKHLQLEREALREVHLAIGMPANERMDWLVEKATELGVRSIQPLMTERSVLKLSGERADKKREHWQNIAIASSEQCGGNLVPRVFPSKTLDQWMAQNSGSVQSWRKLLLSLRPDSIDLGEASFDMAPLLFLCGPEGGLSPAEEETAISRGFSPVSLGARVLRSETAAISAIARLSSN